MTETETLLTNATADGELNPNEWPRVLQDILSRLESIVHNDFPRPALPPDPPPSLPDASLKPDAPTSSQDSQSTNKENAPPTPTRPPVPPFSQSQTPSQHQTQDNGDIVHGALPAEMQDLYASIRTSLTKSFPQKPPHTLQRLAELVLHPKQHYRFLPSYLHALDRVVNVSSPTTLFPLPQAMLPTSSGLLNGSSAASNGSAGGLGSDESLGGALLTPIPWLKSEREQQRQAELKREHTELVDGPNGTGRIETVSVINGVLTTTSVPAPSAGAPPSETGATGSGGEAVDAGAEAENDGEPNPSTEERLRSEGAVTQGELIRQEQEAGVVPVTQHSLTATTTSPTAMGAMHTGPAGVSSPPAAALDTSMDSDEHAEEKPHARGPETIGSEDVGPQHARVMQQGKLDMERAVGRPSSERLMSPEARETEMKDVGKAEGDESAKSPEVEMGDASATAEENSGDVNVVEDAEKGSEEMKDASETVG